MKAFRMLSDKQRYGQICHAAGDLPLFFQPFWLDAVCAEGRWEGWLALD